MTELMFEQSHPQEDEGSGNAMDFLWYGGFIMAPSDRFDEVIEWYCSHMGWDCKANFENAGRMAFLKFPGKGQVVLKSYESQYPQFRHEEAPESRSRLCFSVENKDKAVAYFTTHGIGTSNFQVLPDGRETFEIHAFAGTILTAVTTKDGKSKYPNSRIAGYSDNVMQIRTRNLTDMISFYENVVGMKRLEYEGPEGYARLGAKDARGEQLDLVWLIPAEADHSPTTNQSTQSHFWIGPEKKDFVKAWQQLKAAGHSVSDLSGNPETWAAFYLLDPEGNRVNVWNCK
ncbi:VOC family protein [Cohnella soli]|uniref:VOC family protein n=1 Tax=Cohnella soli TaxID=425005 RepID=A0ABW0I2S8_9BACL